MKILFLMLFLCSCEQQDSLARYQTQMDMLNARLNDLETKVQEQRYWIINDREDRMLNGNKLKSEKKVDFKIECRGGY